MQKLRPWQPQPETQLVNNDGYLMAAEEELKLMQGHAKAVFQRHDRLQFEVSIRPHKAVPQNSASAAAWKLCSDSASEHLAKNCNEQARKAEHSSLDSAVILSAQLKDTDLCFIPKPNKPPTKPSPWDHKTRWQGPGGGVQRSPGSLYLQLPEVGATVCLPTPKRTF